MDYQAQQFKLLPLIASAYALILTGRYMLRVHMESRAEIADGNLESLPEVGGLLTYSGHFVHLPVLLSPSPAACHQCWSEGLQLHGLCRGN